MKAEKRKPLPVDEAAQAQEAFRRESLVANETLVRNQLAARANTLNNRRMQLTAMFADLERKRKGTGNPEAERAGYLRVYKLIEDSAQVLADETGERIEIPDFDPPRVLSSRTRMIGPRQSTAEVITRPDGTKVTIDPATAYKERGGRSPDGRGLPLPAVFGSAADTSWLEVQEAAKKGGK